MRTCHGIVLDRHKKAGNVLMAHDVVGIYRPWQWTTILNILNQNGKFTTFPTGTGWWNLKDHLFTLWKIKFLFLRLDCIPFVIGQNWPELWGHDRVTFFSNLIIWPHRNDSDLNHWHYLYVWSATLLGITNFLLPG